MKLVVDTNVLLGALIRNSTTRLLLMNPDHEFSIPEFALEEVAKYSNVISSKSGLTKKEIKLLLDTLAGNLKLVPLVEFAEGFAQAEKVLNNIDQKDVPFLALALSIKCDGIWSNDKHLKEQKLVKVWNTLEIVPLL